ncbi:ShlB/FhaC/HecB family hemolysin secretion/activation protein [Nitrospira moscoviensis]|uniref:Putative Hemolysin activation/secretion protein n=1 Tax=Nitrospira moscoviensis TaxID=42253 RepID=A0A0K2G6L6_NITMO|nr:ShlB/FhaC/HecB family hemolysin secretion/activation protein [Nitrospira moscoviensis]ALA56588.1 putative Hemolysin activation/secretion protein [Nitrospira moscoviensis]
MTPSQRLSGPHCRIGTGFCQLEPGHQTARTVRTRWKRLVLIVILLALSFDATWGVRDAQPSSTLLVKGFSFSGNTAVSSEDLEVVTQPYVGRSLDLSGLEAAAEQVAAYYRRKGYTLANAYIPQQDIKFGVVTIAILEGRLGDISVTGHRHYSLDFIRGSFAEAMEEGVIRNVALERALLLLNDYPDLKVSAVLEPGRSTGSTNIVAQVEDRRPIHATLDYNNFGFNNISRNRFGAGVEVGNALFDGAVFNFNGIIGDHPDRLQFLIGGYALPLGVHGTKLVLGGSAGRFDVGAELAALQIRGRIKTYDISVTHPFIKTRFQSLLVDIGFSSKDNRLFVLGDLVGNDQVRMAKVGVNYDRLDLSGRSYVSFYGFQGLGEVLGAMDNHAALTTRQGADNRFTKGAVAAGRIQSLGHDVLLIVKGTGQITTGPLVVIEQMLLGGPDSVRGYQLGERFVDEGYTATAETRIPLLPSLLPATQGAIFIDHAAGRLRNPQPGEQASSSLTGAGVGIQTELPYYLLHLRCDVGFPLGPKPNGGTVAGDRSPIFYLQATARF